MNAIEEKLKVIRDNEDTMQNIDRQKNNSEKEYNEEKESLLIEYKTKLGVLENKRKLELERLEKLNLSYWNAKEAVKRVQANLIAASMIDINLLSIMISRLATKYFNTDFTIQEIGKFDQNCLEIGVFSKLSPTKKLMFAKEKHNYEKIRMIVDDNYKKTNYLSTELDELNREGHLFPIFQDILPLNLYKEQERLKGKQNFAYVIYIENPNLIEQYILQCINYQLDNNEDLNYETMENILNQMIAKEYVLTKKS